MIDLYRVVYRLLLSHLSVDYLCWGSYPLSVDCLMSAPVRTRARARGTHWLIRRSPPEGKWIAQCLSWYRWPSLWHFGSMQSICTCYLLSLSEHSPIDCRLPVFLSLPLLCLPLLRCVIPFNTVIMVPICALYIYTIYVSMLGNIDKCACEREREGERSRFSW